MKLTITPRNAGSKTEVKRIRRAGNIPGVIYFNGKPGEPVTIDGSDYEKALRRIQQGHLPTTVFELVDASGKTRRAVVKEVQYQITTYRVDHLDFEELHDDSKVAIKVPIECTGVADCAGVKAGGNIRQVIRHVRVRGYPKDIPAHFEVDVTELGIKQSKRLKDLSIGSNLQTMLDLNQVAVTISKR